jgi:hypothetical protein
MELSTGQQRALFVVVVILLAGLGIYLVGPARHHGPSAGAPPSASASAAAATSAPPSAVQPATSPTPPSSAGGASAGGASAAGGVNIYDWLPFTQQDLTQASQVTLAFATDYGTYSYTETPTAYADKMSSLATAEFAATLKAGYAAAGFAAQRSAQKQVSSSSGGIASIRSFGTDSITFVVNIAQKLTTTKGSTTTTTQYAVTLVSAAGGWQVNDIEYANAGNS